MRKIIKTIATTAAFVLPLILVSCVNGEPGITYTLLWGTKIERVGNNLVIEKDQNGVTTISKKVDGEIKDNLKVQIFTDFHLDHKQELCNYTFTMIAKNIMDVKPDLVLLCGDNITSIENKPRARQFAQMMEDMDVYWSFVLGNHEGSEYPEKPMMSRPEQIELFSQYKHCLIDPSIKKTSDGETVWGDGNHAINVINSKNEVAQTFIFLDSGFQLSDEDRITYKAEIEEFKTRKGKKPDFSDFADYIKDSQIKWFKEVMAKYPTSNATVISHAPLVDMEDGYLEYYRKYREAYEPTGWETDQGITDIWPYTEVTGEIDGCNIKMLLGRRAEGMCYGPYDLVSLEKFGGNGHTPIFNAMIESGGTHPAFFCGHDHQNNFVFDETVDGKTITLGYIQPACYSSNNFWTNGLLGKDPLSDISKYHLIQGYSLVNYNLGDQSKPFYIRHYTNYSVWDGDHYFEAIRLIQEGKDRDYEAKSFPNDPNFPL